MAHLAVLGAGSWGTALALQLARNGHDIDLWAHRSAHIAALNRDRENRRYLPGHIFPGNLNICTDFGASIQAADAVLAVVPSHVFADLLYKIKPYIATTPLMWAIKGFDSQYGCLLSESFCRIFSPSHPYAILAGPSFAKEVAAGKPTAVTIAADTNNTAQTFARYFHGSNFLCYTATDTIGVQIGGAVKNVIAIAAGISDGLGCGANARAALITRGLREIIRLAVALGARPETLTGLAGLGDLLLTCTDNQSRNRCFGLALGMGQSPESAKTEIGQVIEGERATHDTYMLARSYQVRMPITEQLHRMLIGEITLQQTVYTLLNREIKQEQY